MPYLKVLHVIFINRSFTDYAMKCDVCGKTMGETFLKKLIGGYVKDSKGKLHPVCRECQKKFISKEELLKQIK